MFIRTCAQIALFLGRTKIAVRDRKSTRLNSSHRQISYAVFCLQNKLVTFERNVFREAAGLRFLRLGALSQHLIERFVVLRANEEVEVVLRGLFLLRAFEHYPPI